MIIARIAKLASCFMEHMTKNNAMEYFTFLHSVGCIIRTYIHTNIVKVLEREREIKHFNPDGHIRWDKLYIKFSKTIWKWTLVSLRFLQVCDYLYIKFSKTIWKWTLFSPHFFVASVELIESQRLLLYSCCTLCNFFICYSNNWHRRLQNWLQ